MRRVNETVSRQLRKFTSELTAVGNHSVVDLADEDAVIEAFRTIQKYIFGILREATDSNTASDRRKVLMDIVNKGKQELRELKPYIKPETVYELEMSFRNLGDKPKKLSEHKECANMDKKLGDGFEDAIDELVGLSGAYEVSDEPMKNCCDIFADVAADLDCCDDDCDETEMSDAMGMELKDNDEELNEAIKDFLPRAGFIRNEEGGKIGGFVGQGTDDQMRKAKALARARFQYLGDRMGRVSKKDVDNFDEAFFEITGRYPTEEDLLENAQPKSYLKPLKEADDAAEDEIAVADFDAEAGADENPVDEIRMDVPLLMRCLEFAREEAQDDMDLHHLVEKAVEMSKGGEALTMEAYADLIGEDAADEAPAAEAPIEEACKKPLKEGCSGKRKWKRIEKKTK